MSIGVRGGLTAAQKAALAGLGTMSSQDANAVSVTGGSIAGITDLALADGGTGASSAGAARTNLLLKHATFGVDRLAVIAPLIGANYRVIGFPDACGYAGARSPAGRVRRGVRTHAQHTPSALTDGQLIGGFNSESNNRFFRCDTTTTPEWAVYHFFGTGAVASIRGAVTVGAGSPADTTAVGNNCCGMVRRAANFLAFSTDAAGTQTTVDLGAAPSVTTAYVVEILWSSGSLKIRFATIDTDGVWSAWSTQGTISTNLPNSTTNLAPAQAWWVVGTPASAVVDIGGCECLPYAT